MDGKKTNQDLNGNINTNMNTVFTKKVKPINPFVFALMGFGKSIWGLIKWFADLVLSMFISLAQFFKMVSIGVYKGVLGIGNFFKRKAHQYKHNDKKGR